MVVTLPFDPDPDLAELYASVEPTRRKFLEWEFVEETEVVGGLNFRPAGLRALERDLFRSENHLGPVIDLKPDQGLKILGGPKGEGVGLLVAREVRRALEKGVEPEDVLVLVPRLDQDAERIREALLAWNLPVDRGKPRPLATIPAVSALRLAIRIPVEGWEVATLVRLLRNGQVRWGKIEDISHFSRFEAASSIHLTQVFRDRNSLIDALRRAESDPKSRNKKAGLALKILESFAKSIDSIVGRGTWRDQVGRLQRLAEILQLEMVELEPLLDALDDQGWVLDQLGPEIANEMWTWAEFAARVDTTSAAIETPRPKPEPGTIRIEAVSDVEASRGRVVILANLAEKTFPSAEAIELDPSSDRVNLAYTREMFRFARVSGSAEDELILAFPTSDQKGEKLLPAGFLDDLIRRLEQGEASPCVEKHSRLDPVLIGHEDLARSAADARVRAVALACQGKDVSALEALAGLSEHAEALRGTADAFQVARHRRLEQVFGPYDGRLIDPRAIDAIRQKFGPDHTFSPSQLESLALCPFQFYQRYVLGLKMVDERQELDEDYAGRGEDVHSVLEQIHQQAASENASNLIERLTILIDTRMRVDLEQHEGRAPDVANVLKEIGTLRTNMALSRYMAQFRTYSANDGKASKPDRFEVVFGASTEDEPGTDPLTIGEGDEKLLLQGKIDRVDLVDIDGEIKFRVIDYKTGSNPSGKEVNSGLASQLPLYTLAVERLVFADGSHQLADFGYWSLKNDGFKRVKLKQDWETYRAELMEFVLELVGHLRRGTFPIDSLKPGCRSHCDFQAACRVGEVRFVGKKWSDRPTLGLNE
jgi:ATP-dependent helicase/nuclease subunit B